MNTPPAAALARRRRVRGIAVALLFTGIEWILNTMEAKDTILNALALVFIIEIDSLFFTTLVPKQLKVDIANTVVIGRDHTRAELSRRGLWRSLLYLFATLAAASVLAFDVPQATRTKQDHGANRSDEKATSANSARRTSRP